MYFIQEGIVDIVMANGEVSYFGFIVVIFQVVNFRLLNTNIQIL